MITQIHQLLEGKVKKEEIENREETWGWMLLAMKVIFKDHNSTAILRH